MEKLLDGTSPLNLKSSLANIFNVSVEQIDAFVSSQSYRVRHNEYGTYYDNFEFDVIAKYFGINPQDVRIDAISVSHVSAILDQASFYQHGILSLKSLFLKDTPFKSFLQEFDIELTIDANEKLQLLVNGVPKMSGHLELRTRRDQCINGFLFGDDPEHDDNVSEMLKCPEFIADIGRDVIFSRILEDEWMKRSTPSVISFKVLIEEIDGSTFPFSVEDRTENQCYFLIKTFDRLIFRETGIDSVNPMIYLKENVNIRADRIFHIRTIED